MENAKSIDTPISPTTILDEDSNGKKVDETMYRGIIGSLLYLTASRPDIMFSVCKCVRFQLASKESHLTAVKRIIRYLIGTSELGLWYDCSNNFALRGFSDADFASDKTDRKSTSGTCQLLGNALVYWHSKKQNCVALSTTEAEYLAIGSCCTQVLWIMHQLLDYNLSLTSTPIFCDNTSVIYLSKKIVHYSRAKHIEIKHHFIRDHVPISDIVLEFISTDSQLADILTKPLLEERFCFLRKKIGIVPNLTVDQSLQKHDFLLNLPFPLIKTDKNSSIPVTLSILIKANLFTMAKINPSSSTATKHNRRFQKPLNLEEPVDLESSIDSDFFKTDNESNESSENSPISQKRAGKRSMEQTPKKAACKKGKVENTEFGLEDKLIFYGPSEKARFESYKSKSMAYRRSNLTSLFDTIGNFVYEESVRMFYANLFVNDKDDLESMVLGTRIVLDSYQFEKIFSAKFSGFDIFVQNSWPTDFEVSFEEANIFLSDNPSNIGPKNLKFEHRVLAHMIGTTLFPRTGSLSSVSTRDVFVFHCLVNNKRLDWFVWIRQYMLESIRDISSSSACLPYGLLISHILEVMKVDLAPFTPKAHNQHL
uniref:Uncharacterized protein LOC104218513 n=1 Tax=Nicotiana sylvestris TaxID=4096 RepID=A0A1U7VLU5_NICSY|nr:PREDICTED: uncharacterized protein LOC104218513 [Nicotiana sylvestris]